MVKIIKKITKRIIKTDPDVIIILVFALIVSAFVFLKITFLSWSSNEIDPFWASLGILQKAHPDNPIIFPHKLILKRGESADFGVRVYNELNLSLEDAIPFIHKCINVNNEFLLDDRMITLTTTKATINSGEEHGFKAKIKVSEDLAPGMYVCALVVGAEGYEPYVSEYPYGNLVIEITD